MEKRDIPTKELVLRLQELDLMVYATEDEHEPVSMVIVGGAAFMLAGLTDRTTTRRHDMKDITSQAVLSHIDWDLLDALVYDPDEAQASCMSDIEYLGLTYRYKDYCQKYREARQREADHDL